MSVKRFVQRLALAVSLAAIALPQAAFAHDNAELANEPGPHGGMVQMAGNFHLEVAIAADKVTVWVTDHSDEPQPTEGATAKATVFKGSDRITVDLSPTGENQLEGTSAGVGDSGGSRALIDLTMPGEEAMQVRYQFPAH